MMSSAWDGSRLAHHLRITEGLVWGKPVPHCTVFSTSLAGSAAASASSHGGVHATKSLTQSESPVGRTVSKSKPHAATAGEPEHDHAATADIQSANSQLPSPRSQVPNQPSHRQKLLIVNRMRLVLELACAGDCGKPLDQFSAHQDITARTSPHDHGYWLNWQFCECYNMPRPSIG
jgi:hypothetical protein